MPRKRLSEPYRVAGEVVIAHFDPLSLRQAGELGRQLARERHRRVGHEHRNDDARSCQGERHERTRRGRIGRMRRQSPSGSDQYHDDASTTPQDGLGVRLTVRVAGGEDHTSPAEPRPQEVAEPLVPSRGGRRSDDDDGHAGNRRPKRRVSKTVDQRSPRVSGTKMMASPTIPRQSSLSPSSPFLVS